MKKILFLLVAVLCIATISKAAPGDTTWVQANNVQLTYYNNYDTTVTFPAAGTSYRKILMIFTLGKYMCGGTGYCGDWDYTVQNTLMTPGGDTLELGRFITPYANAGAPRTPWTWQQHYVYDVTDYAPVLHGSATMRILFSGYSGGFTGNIRFAFIEGTPDRNVIAVKKLWGGSFNYGDTSHSDSNNINVHYPATPQTAPAGTNSAEVKFTVTGHGADANYCCEFMSHNYQVNLNGATVFNKPIWRSDCGMNELYPQSGTWLYQRANWCPGAMVYSDHVPLPGVTAGTAFNTNVTFDPYVSNGGASYTTFGTLFYYGPVNKITDASIDYIVAPTNDENFFRENPVVGKPIIHVKNTGSATITSMTIQYGLQDSTMSSFNWTGSLASLRDTDIVLPILAQLNAVAGTSGTYHFSATLSSVNGSADEDATNNTLTSSFVAAPYWPTSFRIYMRTNNEADGSGNSETNWTIYDMNDNIIAQRTNAALSTQYIDTVSPGPGSFKLVVTDGSCDGLNWWANAGTGITSGSLYVRKLTTVTNIPMNGYNYSGEYNNDFGCGFTQYFRVDWPLAVTDVTKNASSMEAYPNPAQNTVNITLSGLDRANGTINMTDALGRQVITMPCSETHQQINVGSLPNGVYTIEYIDAAGNKLLSRIVVAN